MWEIDFNSSLRVDQNISPSKIPVAIGVSLACGFICEGFSSKTFYHKVGQLGVNVVNTKEKMIHLTSRTTVASVV